jgi:hypothetical protein
MICCVQRVHDVCGAVVYLGCNRVLAEQKAFDWQKDGLPLAIRLRAVGILQRAAKSHGVVDAMKIAPPTSA